MSYFDCIPDELLSIISLYLSYDEIIELENIFNLKINYQYLLFNKYPAFFNIINVLRNNDERYSNYSFKHAYNLINLVVVSKTHKQSPSNKVGLTTSNVDEFYRLITDEALDIGNIIDLLSAYTLITDRSERSKLYEYRKYFPNIGSSDRLFLWTVDDYISHKKVTMDKLINSYNNESLCDYLITLYRIFLHILNDKSLIKDYGIKIINLKILQNELAPNKHYYNQLITHQYIINYINKLMRN